MRSDISARVDNVEGQVSPDVGVWEMNNPDLKAVNGFGDERIRPATRTIKSGGDHNGFTYNFPKHSLTILTLQLT